MNGDFFEIPEGSPSWDAVVDQLPKHRSLRVSDLPALLVTGERRMRCSGVPDKQEVEAVRCVRLPEVGLYRNAVEFRFNV